MCRQEQQKDEKYKIKANETNINSKTMEQYTVTDLIYSY